MGDKKNNTNRTRASRRFKNNNKNNKKYSNKNLDSDLQKIISVAKENENVKTSDSLDVSQKTEIQNEEKTNNKLSEEEAWCNEELEKIELEEGDQEKYLSKEEMKEMKELEDRYKKIMNENKKLMDCCNKITDAVFDLKTHKITDEEVNNIIYH